MRAGDQRDAADVAGYSRLIGDDEEGTLARLKAIRADLIDLKITEHRGRIVKTTGDGLPVEFSSVVDALRCATQVQTGMAERNAVVPAERRIDWRIGINVGEARSSDSNVKCVDHLPDRKFLGRCNDGPRTARQARQSEYVIV
jgi:adenylate cyclase